MALTNTFNSVYKDDFAEDMQANPIFLPQYGAANTQQKLKTYKDICTFDGTAAQINCLTNIPFNVNECIEAIGLYIPLAFDTVDVSVIIANATSLEQVGGTVFTATGTTTDLYVPFTMPLIEYIREVNLTENLIFVVQISAATAGTIELTILKSDA